jgi:hypothetical protein
VRDDEGHPDDGPKVEACDPPQRFQVDNPHPNCFERTAIYIGAAETIDPTDTDAIADAIVRLATDEDLRRDRAERGLQRARSFSWAQTARDMLAVYHRAAGVTMNAPSPLPVESADQRVPVKSMSRSRLS